MLVRILAIHKQCLMMSLTITYIIKKLNYRFRKKEICSESLETNEQIDEPTEVHACESQPKQITTGVENQPPIHEQKNVPKKAKRTRSKYGFLLPADFEPNLQYAIDQGLTHHEAVSEFERFTNYWIANPGKKCKQTRLAKDWVQLGYTSKVFFFSTEKSKIRTGETVRWSLWK